MKSGGGGVCRCAGVTYCVSRGSIRDDSLRFSPLLFSFRVGKFRKKGAALDGICVQPKIIRIFETWSLGLRAGRGRNVGFRVRGLGGGPRRFMPGAWRSFFSSGQQVRRKTRKRQSARPASAPPAIFSRRPPSRRAVARRVSNSNQP